MFPSIGNRDGAGHQSPDRLMDGELLNLVIIDFLKGICCKIKFWDIFFDPIYTNQNQENLFNPFLWGKNRIIYMYFDTNYWKVD